MDNIAEHYHYIMRYHFHEGLNVTETPRRIYEVYGLDALKERSENDLRIFVSETLVLKTQSDWVARER